MGLAEWIIEGTQVLFTLILFQVLVLVLLGLNSAVCSLHLTCSAGQSAKEENMPEYPPAKAFSKGLKQTKNKELLDFLKILSANNWRFNNNLKIAKYLGYFSHLTGFTLTNVFKC